MKKEIIEFITAILLVLLGAAATAFISYNIIDTLVKKNNQITNIEENIEKISQRYDDLVYENEILWTYVENVDTFKTLDDAISARDRIYDQIQFIDE